MVEQPERHKPEEHPLTKGTSYDLQRNMEGQPPLLWYEKSIANLNNFSNQPIKKLFTFLLENKQLCQQLKIQDTKLIKYLCKKLKNTSVIFAFCNNNLATYRWGYMACCNSIVINLSLINLNTLPMPINWTTVSNFQILIETLLHESIHAIETPGMLDKVYKWGNDWEEYMKTTINQSDCSAEYKFIKKMRKLYEKAINEHKEVFSTIKQSWVKWLKKNFNTEYLWWYPLKNINEHIVGCVTNNIYQQKMLQIRLEEDDSNLEDKRKRIYNTRGIQTGANNNVLIQTLATLATYAEEWEMYKKIGDLSLNHIFHKLFSDSIHQTPPNNSLGIWNTAWITVKWNQKKWIITGFPDKYQGTQSVYIRWLDEKGDLKAKIFPKQKVLGWNTDLLTTHTN